MALQLFKIETVEVASPVSSITFSNIPQGYTDLKLVLSSRSTYAANFGNPRITINGSTSTFSRKSIYAENGSSGSEVGSDTRIIGAIPAANATSNAFGHLEFYMPNYTGSAYKSYSVDSATENNSSSVYGLWILAGLWSTTSAVTSMTVGPIDGNFATNTTATLYGVL